MAITATEVGSPEHVIALALEGRLSKQALARFLAVDRRHEYPDACAAIEKGFTDACAAAGGRSTRNSTTGSAETPCTDDSRRCSWASPSSARSLTGRSPSATT